MLKLVRNFLLQTHYRPKHVYNVPKTTFFTFLVTYSFLIIYEPLELDSYYAIVKYYILLTYSFISALSLYLIISYLKPSPNRRWTYLDDFLAVLLSAITVIISIYIFTYYILNRSLKYFFHIDQTFAIPSDFTEALITYTSFTAWMIYAILNFYSLVKYKSKKNNLNHAHLVKKMNKIDVETIVLIGKNKNEKLHLPSKNLVTIHCKGHYITIFYRKQVEQEKIEKCTMRISMKETALAFMNHPHIVRCHKSYFVNAHYVKRISYDGTKYIAVLKFTQCQIPVSKDKLETLTQEIKKLV